MNNLPQVSVLMCAHKVNPFLFEAIESVLNSTMVNLELILVANGTDCLILAQAVIEAFGEDCRLKVITTPVPQLAYALNRGLEACSSNYVARLDSDDLCECDRFELQLNYLLNTSSDIVGSGCKLINEQGLVIGSRFFPKVVSPWSFLFKNPLCHPSVMYKRSEILRIRGYNSGFASEDYDLWLRAASAGLKIRNINQCLTRYRIHTDSTQGDFLAYAEVSSYYLREFLKSPCFPYLVGFFTSLSKVFVFWIKSFFNR